MPWSPGTLGLLFVLGFVPRLLLAFGIPVPSHDGAHVLAMAERFAGGDAAAALKSVFQPGPSLLLAPFVRMGIEAHDAARILFSLAGAVFAPAVYECGRLLGRRCGRDPAPVDLLLPALFAALSWRVLRLPGEAYREPLFLAAAGTGLALLLRDRPRAAGLCFGLAFWFREEALAFFPLLWFGVLGGRRPLSATLLGAAAAAVLPLWRSFALGELRILPKLGFMLPGGPAGGGDALEVLGRIGADLAAMPVAAFRGLDGLPLAAGLLGLWILRRESRGRFRAFGLPLVLMAGAICMLEVKPRFFLSTAPLILPLAVLGLAACPRKGRPWLRAGMVLSLCATLGFGAADLVRPPKRDKLAEKVLGLYLRDLGVPEGSLVTDLPRVAYYAGLLPPPPARIGAADLARAMEEPSARHAVLGRRRPGRAALLAHPPVGWVLRPLPPAVLGTPGAGRLAWLVREFPR